MNNYKKILIFSSIILLLSLLFLLIFGNRFFNNNKKNEVDQIIDLNKDNINNNYLNIISNLRSLDDNDIFWGNKGKLEIIVYEDLSDLYSLKLNESLNLIKDNFSDEVVIVFRPFADKMFQMSYPVANFISCANEQESFFSARDLVLQKLKDNVLIKEDFSIYAQELNLNLDLFNECIKNDKYYDDIEKISAEAQTFGVYGSPVLFVNKEIVVGARSFDDVINGGGESLLGLKNIINNHLGVNVSDEINDDSSEMIFCTMDAKVCPDGSFVGRDGENNCDFFPCPGE